MTEVQDLIKNEQQKYLDLDEDEILQELTEEELKQLNLDLEEIDPDVRYYVIHFIQGAEKSSDQIFIINVKAIVC